ncbi:YitT family protein [Desulfogranum mediterraneum]|uniref:YitT family protein n=1 Tax=Desulfogranum mediterraneum TaxID=160661 RepID=UPI00041FDEC2|nr:YitT family protein [Desulfogranum mediterraneum]
MASLFRPSTALGYELKNACYIVTGSLLTALGVVLFLAPNNIATGGSPGLGILINHILPAISLGAIMLAINLPLLLIGMRHLGKGFGIRTVISIFLVSGLVDTFQLVLQLEPISDNLLLAALFGGVAIGLGVGLVLRGHGSSGGSTIVARILSDRYGIKAGHTILCIDALIISSSALVFNGIEPSLWSLISIYVTSRCIDMILTGGPSEKVVHIVSEQTTLLAEQIGQHLGPHGTIVQGDDLLSNNQKTMIFIVVEASRITVLRDIIQRHDPMALMVVMDASEMLGRDYRRKKW